MRILLLVLMTLLTAQAPQNAPSPVDPADFGTVEGAIVAANQARPLEGIPVHLARDLNESAAVAQRRGVAVTDSAGQFRLKDVVPGDYVIVADRPGYFRAEENPTRIHVAPKAAVRGITLRMILGGNVSGRIVDINNQGLAGAAVAAMQAGYRFSGERQLQDRTGPFVTTDDRGEYRLQGVRPGTYYVRANLDFWASDSTVFYPGTKDELAAVPIVVREAQDSIANMRLEVKLRPVFTISGTVTSGIAGVLTKPIPRIFVAQGGDGGTYYDNRADDRSNGRFEIRNIFAGAYELYPEARDAAGRLYTSRTTVEVVNKNIENLTLPAVPIVDVRGRVLLNGEAPGGRFPSPNVPLNIQTVRGLNRFLIYMETPGGNAITGPNTLMDKETGDFTIVGMPPGVYKLSVSGIPAEAYLEDLRQGSATVFEEGFTVTDRPGDPIQVLLASPGAKVDGVVRNTNQEPVPSVLVVLIPEASRRQDTARFKSIASDQDGKFLLRGIPPGNYKLFAVDNFPNNAWRNADLMKKFDARGRSVTLGKGTSVTVDLPRILWEEPTP